MISKDILARSGVIRDSYQKAQPFRHVCLDGFLEPAMAEQLYREFPPFDPVLARNEMGKVGGKAVNTDLRNIGPAYREFYDYMCSPRFLGAMSDLLGVPGLLFDPAMYGGGTHENLNGQELDPHIDFNYDPRRKLHRRMNLLIYLNKEWDLAWGGGIELHSNPRDWDHDEIKSFNCEFNRGVIFETNEHSWHGFPRIQLPPDKRDFSRKCISIYLYTKTRPQEETAPPHSTFYVQRPLPKRIVAGRTLTAEDVDEIRRLMIFRDGWIYQYQKQELQRGREMTSLAGYIMRGMLRKLRRLLGLPARPSA
ncbi:MAG TPA: 2OG-Fe(II) oxygenase [Gammaproteobacteria bacterium]